MPNIKHLVVLADIDGKTHRVALDQRGVEMIGKALEVIFDGPILVHERPVEGVQIMPRQNGIEPDVPFPHNDEVLDEIEDEWFHNICTEHRAYKAINPPDWNCPQCQEMWEEAEKKRGGK
jgi:hypothetical protein